MDQHNKTVAEISTRLKDLYVRKEKFRIFHGSTNSTRSYKISRTNMIDTSSLTHVLGVDTTTRTALVEPNVPMDQLVAETLPYGLVPPVVMEFKGITVGGGFSGTGAESSSFKHGSFDASVTRIEIVLATGEVVNASKDSHPDLFQGATSTLGTLGVTTLLEVELVEAKRYVEVTYLPFNTLESTLEGLKRATEDASNDYVDGILMSINKGIIVTGRLTDTIPSSTRIQRFQRAQDPWFYIHASRLTNSGIPVTEAVPLHDYLFRYDRGAFWMGEYAFSYFLTPFNRVTRWVLDDFMQTRTMYHALHASGHMKQYIIQDLCIPSASTQAFIEDVDALCGFYPLWLCPVQPTPHPSFHPHALNTSEIINVGVWGPGSTDPLKAAALNRELEALVQKHGGRKWLYAQAFYSESEFWDVYKEEEEWYNAVRLKYGAHHLDGVFGKACGKGRESQETQGLLGRVYDGVWGVWPLSGLYGVVKTLTSKEYLLAK